MVERDISNVSFHICKLQTYPFQSFHKKIEYPKLDVLSTSKKNQNQQLITWALCLPKSIQNYKACW